MIVALLACVSHVQPGRVAPPMAEPEPELAPAPPSPPPPSSWRTGHQSGAIVATSPVVVWSHVLDGPITEPIATDGTRFFVVSSGTVYCFDAKGAQRWAIRVDATGGVAMTARGPVVGTQEGRVLLLDANDGATSAVLGSDAGGGAVSGLAVESEGAILWVTQRGTVGTSAGWARTVGLSAAGGLAADQDTVYVATREGNVIAANATGELWRAVLPAGAVEGATLDAMHVFVPVAASQGVPGGVVAFDRAGKEVWRRQTDFQPAASLALGVSLFLPDKDAHLYALDPATGEDRWVLEGFGDFGVQPVVVGSSVYAGNGDGNLYRVDGVDGGVAWKVQLGAPVTGEPALAGGLLVVGLANGRVVALSEGD